MVLQEITLFQQVSYGLSLDAVVSAKLRSLPGPPPGEDCDRYKEATLFALSLKREPRNATKAGLLLP